MTLTMSLKQCQNSLTSSISVLRFYLFILDNHLSTDNHEVEMTDMDNNTELIAQNINVETEQLKTTTATVTKTEFSVDKASYRQ